MSVDPQWSAAEIATRVRDGRLSALAVTEAALARVAAHNPRLNAFTDITAQRALDEARAVDAAPVKGPLAGVPYAVKNLFDIQGLPTRAGSRINRERAPAPVDAILVQRMKAAGAVLLGGLNMGEYAYDFTGENSHDGACRNPHDETRMTGGSSSGSASAVGGALVPVTLGSDTNGSIRVPASLCGVYGLKPTYGRLPRTGTFPFCDSLDHLGPLARSVRDLALVHDALQGHDEGDAVCAPRASEPVMPMLDGGVKGLRIAVAGGYFDTDGLPEAAAAVAAIAKALDVTLTVVPEGAAEGRAAAFLITNAESSTLHLDRLRTRAADFDPDTRDRFLAGALLPAAWLVRAQQVRRWYHDRMMRLFHDVDVLLAPATPFPAPAIGQKTMMLRGAEVAVRPNLGLFTQPFSAIGLPVCAVPVAGLARPIGVQVVTAPWREDLCLRVAAHLEKVGAVAATKPAD